MTGCRCRWPLLFAASLAALAATPLRAQLPPPPLALRPAVKVVFRVADLERSVQFFSAVLGTSIDFVDSKAGLAELPTAGGVRIGLVRGERPNGNGVVPTFEVLDITTAQKTLQALKVAPLGPVQEVPGQCRLLRFADPDGNEIQLAQSLRPPADGMVVVCAAPTPMAKVLFLTGTWRSEQDGTVQEEVWAAPAGDCMHGQNRTSAGDDLRAFELLRIVQRGKDLFYEARPGGGAATAFRLVAAEADKVTFANPEHDFPKRITYWLHAGRLHAAIDDGTDHGIDKGKRVEFVWSRVP